MRLYRRLRAARLASRLQPLQAAAQEHAAQRRHGMTFSNLFAPSVAAIRGNSQAFQVIGENIANSVTPGFKSADTRFVEVLTANPGTEFESLGGIRPSTQFFIGKQGVLETSDNPLDVAITGRGFLIGNTQADESGEYQLTRAGVLGFTTLDNNGTEETYLTDLAGNFVLGWPADALGNFAAGSSVASLDPIQVDSGSILFTPVATTAATLGAILPAGAAAGDSYTASLPVIDAAGAEHALSLQFTRTATPNVWTSAASVSGGTVTSGEAATITFDATGAIVSPASQSVGLSFAAPGGATTVAVDYAGLLSFAGAFNVTGVTQNGIPAGDLESLAFDEDGVLSGFFNNGRSRPLFKLPLAIVPNPDGLDIASNTHYTVSDNSGDLTLFEADLTEMGRFTPSAIEQSTTDLSLEFTKLILIEQSYTSAVQAYTVVDEMAQVASDLKR
jgi:flagellar hook protein FlgE